jgi:hypothetical protein
VHGKERFGYKPSVLDLKDPPKGGTGGPKTSYAGGVIPVKQEDEYPSGTGTAVQGEGLARGRASASRNISLPKTDFRSYGRNFDRKRR